MLDLILFEYERDVSLYQKGWQFSWHLITGIYVKDLSLENVDLILFKLESLYQKGCKFSCHLMTGRNVKDLSLENVNLIFLGRKFIPKGVAVENVDLILF